jgi:hypothetical protein
MLKDHMSNFLKSTFAGAFVISMMVLIFCVGPFLVIVAVNFIAEIGGAEFYIEHGLLNYLIVFFVLFVFKLALGR